MGLFCQSASESELLLFVSVHEIMKIWLKVTFSCAFSTILNILYVRKVVFFLAPFRHTLTLWDVSSPDLQS